MPDKTPLERDIEQRELVRTSWKIKIFIVILLTGLCALGYYSYDLKQKLSEKEQEIVEIKEMFQEESNELIDEIKNLEISPATKKSGKK